VGSMVAVHSEGMGGFLVAERLPLVVRVEKKAEWRRDRWRRRHQRRSLEIQCCRSHRGLVRDTQGPVAHGDRTGAGGPDQASRRRGHATPWQGGSVEDCRMWFNSKEHSTFPLSFFFPFFI
jgi:hypothetical protein